MSRNTVVSSYCVFMIIRQLKSLKFCDKEKYFQKHAASFIRLPYILKKDERVSKKCTFHYSIITRYLLIKEIGLFFLTREVYRNAVSLPY